MDQLKWTQEKLFHTVDVGSKSEVGNVRERLGDIRVGARDISVFLGLY